MSTWQNSFEEYCQHEKIHLSQNFLCQNNNMLKIMANKYKLLFVIILFLFFFNFSIKLIYPLINSNHFQRSLKRKSVLWLLIIYISDWVINYRCGRGGGGVEGAYGQYSDDWTQPWKLRFLYESIISRMGLNYLVLIKERSQNQKIKIFKQYASQLQ